MASGEVLGRTLGANSQARTAKLVIPQLFFEQFQSLSRAKSDHGSKVSRHHIVRTSHVNCDLRTFLTPAEDVFLHSVFRCRGPGLARCKSTPPSSRSSKRRRPSTTSGRMRSGTRARSGCSAGAAPHALRPRSHLLRTRADGSAIVDSIRRSGRRVPIRKAFDAALSSARKAAAPQHRHAPTRDWYDGLRRVARELGVFVDNRRNGKIAFAPRHSPTVVSFDKRDTRLASRVSLDGHATSDTDTNS